MVFHSDKGSIPGVMNCADGEALTLNSYLIRVPDIGNVKCSRLLPYHSASGGHTIDRQEYFGTIPTATALVMTTHDPNNASITDLEL